MYRLSSEKIIEYLRLKVDRLSVPETVEVSRTMVRNLAKDGLMEDGKEQLLKRESMSVRCTSSVEITITVGRVRAACDLVAQYISPSIRASLTASYE